MRAVEVQQTELMLCLGVTLRCRQPIIGSGIGEGGENAVSTGVE
jgi:hypothetical protein